MNMRSRGVYSQISDGVSPTMLMTTVFCISVKDFGFWSADRKGLSLSGMKIDVVSLPRMLTEDHVRDRVVVVFDVLRATTTIAAALDAGAREIRVFASLDAARLAAAEY